MCFIPTKLRNGLHRSIWRFGQDIIEMKHDFMDPKEKVWTNENKARNIGKGEWIWIVDSFDRALQKDLNTN